MKASLPRQLMISAWLSLLPVFLPQSHASAPAFQHQRLAFLRGINLPYPSARDWFEGKDGGFYVTIVNSSPSVGAVYRIDRDGRGFTSVYSDSTNLLGGLLIGQDGRLYGGVFSAPAAVQAQPPRIFSVSPSGNGAVDLKVFPSHELPWTGVIQDAEGWLYGTTIRTGGPGGGIIFKLGTNGGNYSVLHEFGSVPNDGLLAGTLAIGTNGWLYGCTLQGGSANYGTIFRLRRDGTGYEILHHFDNTLAGGRNPITAHPLLVASDGHLYGAADGGTNRAGLLFRIAHDGSDFQSVHHFAGEDGLGDSPIGGLAEWCDGNLYGATVEGGIDGAGMVFKVGKDGSDFTPLKVFIDRPNPGDTDGTPTVPIIIGSDQRLYGLTSGGSAAQGTLFRINFLPALAVRHLAGDVSITWSDCTGQFILQSTINVRNNAEWQPVNAAPEMIGGERRVIVPGESVHRLFRLTRP